MPLPRHSGQDDDTEPVPERSRRRTAIIVAAVTIVIFVVALLHLTGTIKH
jgi:hypothetical protein